VADGTELGVVSVDLSGDDGARNIGLGGDGQLTEDQPGRIETLAVAGGEEAVGTGIVKCRLGNMRQDAAEEFRDGKGHEAGVGAGWIFVVEQDGGLRFTGDTAVGHGTASDISAEILDDAAAVSIRRHDHDVPGSATEAVEEVETTLMGKIGREGELGLLESLT